MFPLEIEVPGVLVGFALGGLSFLVHGLVFAARPPKARDCAKAREGAKAQEAQEAFPSAGGASPASSTEEPSPEPSPELDCRDELPAAAQPSVADSKEPAPAPRAAERRWRWADLAMLAAVPVAVALGAALLPPGGGPGPALDASEAALAEVLELPRAEELLQVAPVAAGAEEIEAAEGEEAAAEAEGEGSVMTLRLTRQQLTVHQDEGIYYKTAYWGTVHVGEPATSYAVVFDTGSGHLILPSTYCHSATCRSHKRYRRANSATAKDIDYDGVLVQPGELRDHITVSFGTGEVTGVFIEDVVCLDRQPKAPAFNHTVAAAMAGSGAIAAQRSGVLPEGCMGLRMIAATDMSEDPFKDFQFDGVLGLGLSGLSQSPEFNLMHVIASMTQQAKGLNPHMFAVFLAEHDSEQSEITFGGYTSDRLGSELAWHPVYEPEMGQWMVEVKSIRVDDGEPIEFCKEGCRAIVDTGTSLIAVPTAVFPELFELLLHPAVAEECKGPGPKFHIELESITVTLEPRDYSLFESAAGSRVRALITQDEDEADEDMCKAMLMAMDLPEPLGPKLFVLGEPVLRRYYTVYDSGPSPRVGFALARHELGDA